MLTDEQKQALCEQYGCCNWALLDAAARLGRLKGLLDAKDRCLEAGAQPMIAMECGDIEDDADETNEAYSAGVNDCIAYIEHDIELCLLATAEPDTPPADQSARP